jgi:hypothetical protein
MRTDSPPEDRPLNDGTPALKLAALDPDDLAIVSAHLQDAVLKVGDIAWRPGERRLLLTLNRFAWEAGNRAGAYERRRAVVHLARVTGVQHHGLDPRARERVLDLLAVTFTPTEAPSGLVTFVFAGGGTLRASVECIEASLTDLGAAWAARAKPDHGA